MLWFYSLRTALSKNCTVWEHSLSGQIWTKCPTRPDTQGAPRGGCSLHPYIKMKWYVSVPRDRTFHRLLWRFWRRILLLNCELWRRRRRRKRKDWQLRNGYTRYGGPSLYFKTSYLPSKMWSQIDGCLKMKEYLYSRTCLRRPPHWLLKCLKTGGLWQQVRLHWNVKLPQGISDHSKQEGLSCQWLPRIGVTVLKIETWGHRCLAGLKIEGSLKWTGFIL